MAKTKEIKKKKKKWFSIYANQNFNNLKIGESLGSEIKDLIGRKINVNLSVLFNDPKKQSINGIFKIKEIKGDNAVAEIVGYELTQSHLKRTMRRSKDKIEDSFVCETKDKIKVRIKPFLLTKAQTKRSILSALKLKSREFFNDISSKLDYNDLIQSVISNRIQKDLKNNIKKIYPIILCEIRILERIN
jgi:small subunit ribosomal protein S3Ae